MLAANFDVGVIIRDRPIEKQKPKAAAPVTRDRFAGCVEIIYI